MSNLRIEHLTADHLASPMGVCRPPVLAWQLMSDGQNVRQAAYRVQVAADAAFTEVLADTGAVESDNSIHTVLDDLPLESARRYFWRVWVKAGDAEAWSNPAAFVTGLKEGFAADFVSAQTEADADTDRGSVVYAGFDVDGEVAEAYAYTTALGVYHLLVDGQSASDRELAPGWTSYRHQLLYQTTDLTARLTPGHHEIAGELGSGWFKGQMGFLHRRNNYGTRTAFLCQLMIRYRDGRVQRVMTDENWQGADTGVLFSDIYNGETYDARFTRENQRPVTLAHWDKTALTAQSGCTVKIIETLPVKEIITTPKGETVLDFGQDMTGFIRFRVRGKAGDVAELQCFEVLDKDGNVYTANLRKAKATLTYTLSGDGEETYQPHHTFQGFRYAHVKQWPGTVRAEDFTACVVHSDMTPTGSFSCSEPLLNQLWHNILWGLKGNFLDVPTDCPQRDERMGWTGDAQIFSATACILMDVYRFYSKWLRDVAADQTAAGGVPHVVPDIISGVPGIENDWLLSQGADSATAWADVAVIMPWNMYVAYGDKDVLAVQYDSMRAWVDRMHDDFDHWLTIHQFGDWVALDAAEGSYYGATPNDLTCTAYAAFTSGLMSKAAAVLGHREDAARYARYQEEAVSRFRSHYFTPEGDMTAQTQTAHVLALHFDLVPEKWRQKTLQRLKELLQARDGHLVTGFVGTPYIAHALSDNGALADAYALVEKKDFPSWLYQVTVGATTVWEHWDGIKPDGSMWSPDMNSFNHYAYGAVGEWMFKVIGGIRPVEADPGYHTVRFTPRPGGGITHAAAAIDTVYGRTAIAWRETDGLVEAQVTVPCNARAVIEVVGTPADDRLAVGQDGLLTAEMGSGEHTFRWRL